MMQNEGGTGECERLTIVSTLGAVIMDTQLEGSFPLDYSWRKLKKMYLETHVPKSKVDHEDRLVEWLSYLNNNHWIDGGKKFLIDIGFAYDEPCVLDGKNG